MKIFITPPTGETNLYGGSEMTIDNTDQFKKTITPQFALKCNAMVNKIKRDYSVQAEIDARIDALHSGGSVEQPPQVEITIPDGDVEFSVEDLISALEEIGYIHIMDKYKNDLNKMSDLKFILKEIKKNDLKIYFQ